MHRTGLRAAGDPAIFDQRRADRGAVWKVRVVPLPPVPSPGLARAGGVDRFVEPGLFISTITTQGRWGGSLFSLPACLFFKKHVSAQKCGVQKRKRTLPSTAVIMRFSDKSYGSR